MASRAKSIQNVNSNVKKWNEAIADAQSLLEKVESRAARLKGAIKTFEELRDLGHDFSAQSTLQTSEPATQC